MTTWTNLFLHRRRWLWSVVIAISLLAAAGMPQLSFEERPQRLFRQDDSESAQLDQLLAEFSSQDAQILLAVECDDLFSAEALIPYRTMVQRIREVAGVAHVTSIFDSRRQGSSLIPLFPSSAATRERYERARREARQHPMVAHHFLSDEDDTSLVVVQLEGRWLSSRVLKPIVDDIRLITAETSATSPLRMLMTGMPVIRMESLAMVQRDQLRFTLLALGLATIVALCLFRRLAAVVVAVAAPLLGTLWALGLIGLLDVPINGFNMMLPTLVLVIGFTDSVHLVVDIRRSLSGGQSGPQAAATAVAHLGPPCFLTSLTTAIGFGSLVVSKTVSVREFGWVCALGVVLSFLAVMLVVPLLTSSRFGQFMVGPQTARGRPKSRIGDARWLAGSLKYPRTRVVTAVLLLVLLAPLPARLRPNVSSTEAIPQQSETIRALRVCDRALGGSLPVFVVLEWPAEFELTSGEVLATLQDLHDRLELQPDLARPFSILTMLRSLPPRRRTRAGLERIPGSLQRQLVREDLHKLVVALRVPHYDAEALRPIWTRLDNELANVASRHPGFHLHLTGSTVVASRTLQQVVGDLTNSLGLAGLVIIAVLTLVFRSPLLGLISIVPNLFPLLTNMALLVLMDWPLQLTSVLTFSLCLGIAADDTIHFLMRFRRELAAGWGVHESVLRSYRYVGPVLIATTMILMSGFAVIAISEVPALRLFAMLSCTALMAALVADLVLLPALLQCCGPRLSKRR